LSLLAYNLGNLWRRLVPPKGIDAWLLTSLQQRLAKTGGRLVKHARYYWLLLGTPLISLWPALAAISLCRGREKRTMRETEVQIGNSGL